MRLGSLAVACLLAGSSAVQLKSVGEQGNSEQMKLLGQVELLGGQAATSEGKSHAFFAEEENQLNTLDATDGAADIDDKKQDTQLLMQTSSEATNKPKKAIGKRKQVGLLAQTHTDSQEQQWMNEMSEQTLDSESQVSSAAQAGQKVESRFFYIDDFFYWLGCKFVTCDKQQPQSQLSKQLKGHAVEPLKITQPTQMIKAPISKPPQHELRQPVKQQQQEELKVVTEVPVSVVPKASTTPQIKQVNETVKAVVPKDIKVKTSVLATPVKPKVPKLEQPKQAPTVHMQAKKQTIPAAKPSPPKEAATAAPNTISMPIKQNTLNIGHKDQVSAILGPTAMVKPATTQPSFTPKILPTPAAHVEQKPKLEAEKVHADSAATPQVQQQEPQSQQNPFADFSGFEKKVESMHPLQVPHVAIPSAAPVVTQAVVKPIAAPSQVQHSSLPSPPKQQMYESRPLPTQPQMRAYAPQPKPEFGTFQQQANPYYGMQQQPQQRVQMQTRMYPYGQPQQQQPEQQDDEDVANGDDDQEQQVEPATMPVQQQGGMAPMMYQQQAPQMKMGATAFSQFQPPIGLAQLLRYQQQF